MDVVLKFIFPNSHPSMKLLLLLVCVACGFSQPVLKTQTEYRCLKHVDYLELSGDASKNRCDFTELKVSDAAVDVIVQDNEKSGSLVLGLRIRLNGTSGINGFAGDYKVVATHMRTSEAVTADLSKYPSKSSFCCSFIQHSEYELCNLDSCPSASPETEFTASHVLEIPSNLPGTWNIDLLFIAESGSTLGKLQSKVKITKRHIAALELDRKTEL